MAPTKKTSAEKLVSMSLDDIIKTQKKTSGPQGKPATKRAFPVNKITPAAKSVARTTKLRTTTTVQRRTRNVSLGIAASEGGQWKHDLFQGAMKQTRPAFTQLPVEGHWQHDQFEGGNLPLAGIARRAARPNRLAGIASRPVAAGIVRPSAKPAPAQSSVIMKRQIPVGGLTTGTKVTVANLPSAVVVDDLQEVFGADGVRLKSVKLVSDGVAEVVFARREDAVAAVAKYDNVPLDGRAMILKLDPVAAEPPQAARPMPVVVNPVQATKRLLQGALPQ